jgi:hypothetical protein
VTATGNTISGNRAATAGTGRGGACPERSRRGRAARPQPRGYVGRRACDTG